ncbi:meiosis-specific coiled-coil domain-containing protein MEIOC [Limanda limanda]|uniref:meiosis-specific coiled-coil domain-containing protein MEIOC n=1 Tax=Limanda limanda TaxID=27771 RepID=UPI0029C6842D|nr:meiosis-specific coiled-coil domain-containing protein MEIOC [Limanda limanda]
MMEHAEVASLLYRMEYLCNIPIHINIRTALNKYHEAVCGTQAMRKQISTMSKPQQQRGHIPDTQDLLLIITLKHLAATTRKLRVALWCAVQMTLPLPQPVGRQDDQVSKQATLRNEHTSAFKENSFRL